MMLYKVYHNCVGSLMTLYICKHWKQTETKRIKNTQIGSKSMLDQSVGLYFTEGGNGRDYHTGQQNVFYPHSSENATMIIAGKLGGLKPGKHFDTSNTHQAKVFTSVLRAFGINTNSLGDVSGIVDRLFT